MLILNVVVTVELGTLARGGGLMAAAVAAREEILRADRAMTQIAHMFELCCTGGAGRGSEV